MMNQLMQVQIFQSPAQLYLYRTHDLSILLCLLITFRQAATCQSQLMILAKKSELQRHFLIDWFIVL
jgi:hypothetical protein